LPEKISEFNEIIEAINFSVFATTLKTLNWRDVYSVYNDTISDEEIDNALQALSGLKNNLEQAKECNCGILYLLN
jgi:hypothetical protein